MEHARSKRNPAWIVLGAVIALAVLVALVWFLWLKDFLTGRSAAPVYVNSVSSIVGADFSTESRYTGVVEPQKTFSVNRDVNRTVSEIFVEEGDQVSVGDKLFSYDTEEMQLSISQAELDLDGIKNQVSTLKTQLADLEKEKKNAGNDAQYAYTVQIQSVQLQIRSQENAQTQKEAEIAKLKDTLENAVVLCETEGVIKAVNADGQTDMYGNAEAFISILSSGEFRIKGTISELNVASLYEGMPVTVISRIDPAKTWAGAIDSVDLEPTSDNNNNYYYYGMDAGESSSKYNFYVTLSDPTDLILGQHIYIQPDTGDAPAKTGLWLPGSYIVHEGAEYYVWAKSDSDRIIRKTVKVGDYDANEDLYQITGGLARTDYIAYPDESVKAGAPTTTEFNMADYGSDFDLMTDDFTADGFMDGDVYNYTDDYMPDIAVDEGAVE